MEKPMEIFLDTQKAKCDQFEGSYTSIGDQAVTTVNLTHSEAEKVWHDKKLTKIFVDANWNWDPTLSEKNGVKKIVFRLKKQFTWDTTAFYNSLEEKTRIIMVGKQHHVNQQAKERDGLKALLGFLKPSSASVKIKAYEAVVVEKLMKKMKMSKEDALEFLQD